jgi:hypothetical protein
MVFGLGFALPVILRLVQNAWALGGLSEVFSDFFSIAQTRAAVGVASEYSVFKHAAKFIVALSWFAGVPALILALTGGREVWRRCVRTDRTLLGLLIVWLIGSLSWQVLMRQHGLVHAFTYLHFGNFILLLAALSVAALQQKRPTFVLVCLIAQVLWAGSLIRSEIQRPFIEDSTRSFAASLCSKDREDLARSFEGSGSLMMQRVKSAIEASPPALECGVRSHMGLRMLKFYGFFIKSTVSRGA